MKKYDLHFLVNTFHAFNFTQFIMSKYRELTASNCIFE